MSIISFRRVRGLLKPALLNGHPYLFAVWFVLEYARRIPQSPLSAAALALALLFAAVTLVTWAAGQFVHDRTRAALLTTVLFFPLLYFQPGQYLLSLVSPALASYRCSVPVIAAVAAVAFVWLLKTKSNLRFLENVVTTVLSLFVALQLVMIATRTRTADTLSESTLRRQLGLDQPVQGGADTAEGPDIYYILLDSYTGPGSLSRYWGFDESEFFSELEGRGFFIASHSKSHYTATAYSLAASLNMDTLSVGSNPFDLIRSNLFTEYLRSKHYRIENLSLFDLDNAPRFYSFFSSEEGSSAGLEYYFNNTGIGVLLSAYHAQSMPDENLRVLKALAKEGRDTASAPKFVYAHLLTPHGPFGLDRNGKVIPMLQRKGWRSTSAYLDQLEGTNELLMPVIDQILSHARREPVIIVQGDHGSRLLPGAEGLKESHTILNAYHLPGDGNRLLYPTISPVNSFRVVLRYCFGEPIPLTADFAQ